MLNSCRTFICLFENRSTKFRSSYRFPGNNSGKVHLVPIFFGIFSNFRFWCFLYFYRVVLWKVCKKKWSVLYTKLLRSLRNNFRSFDVLEVTSVLDQLEFFFQRGSTDFDQKITGFDKSSIILLQETFDTLSDHIWMESYTVYRTSSSFSKNRGLLSLFKNSDFDVLFTEDRTTIQYDCHVVVCQFKKTLKKKHIDC